ncbi:FGGY family carbohydrate kinase, partial [Micromonospora aurantiaca (nom. illeg.)]|uniref:FGGY family carbohydrate kinase n=1 Tax=Micromonospora aurantiaca (nom. illeg.) TaxID=47850 RepID=UPI003822E7BD
MPLVAGVDSSTQSCKVVVRDAETGALVRQGRAPHPPGTEVDPYAWWEALQAAVAEAGGLGDVAAISVGGQQHGMVCLDTSGEVVRPALLWNDIRSADAARELVEEAGGGETGRRFWAEATGAVPVASFTATKLRWLARHEPDNADRVAAVCLPHDWLTWRLAGADGLVLVPYLEGERTPDRPHATGELKGLTLHTSTPAHLARAAVEGMLCGLADGLDALIAQGARADRIILVGGGARSEAVRRIAPQVFGRPV